MTDDPERPGDGKWEINIAAIGSCTPGRWDMSLPDIDINYGLGDHIQLKIDTPLLLGHDDGGPNFASIGAPILGVKWRFLDKETAGFSASIYPQFAPALTGASLRHDLVESKRQFFLPVAAAAKFGELELDAETGYNFIDGQPGEWILGAVAAHVCGEGSECLLEVRQTLAAGLGRTLVNVGYTYELTERVSLIAAAGHESGSAPETQSFLGYLGLRLSL